MITNRFEIQAKVWVYAGVGGWHFLTVPKKQSHMIKKAFATLNQGWGSIPVTVTIGQTTWKTSIFPDTKMDSYQLPLKAEVRKKEKIGLGDKVIFTLEIMV
jgi:hypothetical protein